MWVIQHPPGSVAMWCFPGASIRSTTYILHQASWDADRSMYNIDITSCWSFFIRIFYSRGNHNCFFKLLYGCQSNSIVLWVVGCLLGHQALEGRENSVHAGGWGWALQEVQDTHLYGEGSRWSKLRPTDSRGAAGHGSHGCFLQLTIRWEDGRWIWDVRGAKVCPREPDPNHTCEAVSCVPASTSKEAARRKKLPMLLLLYAPTSTWWLGMWTKRPRVEQSLGLHWWLDWGRQVHPLKRLGPQDSCIFVQTWFHPGGQH